jgi:hypothetical protein
MRRATARTRHSVMSAGGLDQLVVMLARNSDGEALANGCRLLALLALDGGHRAVRVRRADAPRSADDSRRALLRTGGARLMASVLEREHLPHEAALHACACLARLAANGAPVAQACSASASLMSLARDRSATGR